MSEVILDTITGKSTATTITIGSTPVVSASANSMTIRGEGTAQTSIQQGLAKCWLNGTPTAGINDSFNVTSGTDNGTGDYTFEITNDMANANYSIVATASNIAANQPIISCNPTNDTNSTSVYRLQMAYTQSGTGGYIAIDKLTYSALFGDLA